MKPTINNLILFVFLATCIAWINCGDDENPLEPSQLTGTYTFGSLTDKVDNITIDACDIVDLDGPGALPEGALTGILEFTETTFTVTFTIIPTGAPPQTFTASGTYATDGATLTFNVMSSTLSIFPVGPGFARFSLTGDRLEIEIDVIIFVFDKQ